MYSLIFQAQEEAFSSNNISGIDPLASTSIFPTGQQSENDERKATFVPVKINGFYPNVGLPLVDIP